MPRQPRRRQPEERYKGDNFTIIDYSGFQIYKSLVEWFKKKGFGPEPSVETDTSDVFVREGDASLVVLVKREDDGCRETEVSFTIPARVYEKFHKQLGYAIARIHKELRDKAAYRN